MNKKITLTIDSEPIQHLINADYKFQTLFNLVGALSYQLNNDPYTSIVETVVGQMLSNKVADIMIDRLINICESGRIDTGSIKQLSVDSMRSIGISRRKAQCIVDFTSTYNKKAYSIKNLSLLTDEEIIERITSIKGLGIWSAKMFLLFVMGRENVMPYEDMAFLQAFVWYHELPAVPPKDEIKEFCKKWSPYISIAARYLYKALDNGLTKKSFASYTNIA
jgi:DNA-3-methyladenine glycosylase II